MTELTGTWRLIRLILRRDRVVMPIWIFWLGVIPVAGAVALVALFPNPEQMATFAQTLRTPALTALYGPLFGDDLGAAVTTRYGIVPVVLGLITMLTVIRHTRAEEEAGRRELLRSSVMGRHAGLAAALIVTFAASLLVGLMVAVTMSTQGVTTEGSWALGLSYAAVGCVFAAVGGVVSQLTESAGAARGFGLVTLGVVFGFRMAGDLSGDGLSWLSWLSPIGWGQQIRPYADERWWVFLLLIGLCVISSATAVALSARRDIAAGFISPRPGPASASPGFRNTVALAWRLHRTRLVSWTIGLAAFGFVMGSAAEGLRDLFAGTPDFEEIIRLMGGQSAIIDAFLAAVLNLFALIASGYGVQAALRMQAEESESRLEPLLATSVGRVGWMGSHLLFVIVGPSLAVLATGLGEAVGYGLSIGDVGGQLGRILGGALVQLPAVWLVAGLAVALFGLLPQMSGIAWWALAGFGFLGFFGASLRFDQILLDLSPFTHVPRLPGAEMSVLPLFWLTSAALVLIVAGLAGFRRRDLAATA